MRYTIGTVNAWNQDLFWAGPIHGFQPQVYQAYDTLQEAQQEADKHPSAKVWTESDTTIWPRIEVPKAESLGLRPGFILEISPPVNGKQSVRLTRNK